MMAREAVGDNDPDDQTAQQRINTLGRFRLRPGQVVAAGAPHDVSYQQRGQRAEIPAQMPLSSFGTNPGSVTFYFWSVSFSGGGPWLQPLMIAARRFR